MKRLEEEEEEEEEAEMSTNSRHHFTTSNTITTKMSGEKRGFASVHVCMRGPVYIGTCMYAPATDGM